MTAPAERLGLALEDRYRIERELGQGGMATVYLAHDVRHERKVAIKVLKPELAAVLGAERFLAEIRTTARLHHPHILPLLDSGAAEGLLYYVMPHLTGETLRQRLERETQLGVEETVRITRALAAALDYAHGQGVIHRDLKPENILFQANEPVLADFGIALAVKAAGGQRLTETGLSLGTPQYMSPEQAAGDRVLDARSDVYSLGSVVYELLAGEPPHTGPTVAAVIMKVVTQAPVPLGVVRPGLPPGVEEAVLEALAKVPADRFASAGSFAAALVGAIEAIRRPAAPAAAPVPSQAATATPARAVKSIVVLPFSNVSPDPDTEYFSDGLTDEIITDLSRVRSLRVISRTSAMRLKGDPRDLTAIGRDLACGYVLEGSVRRAADSLRITARLVDATSNDQLWAEKYGGTLDDVFDIQERVSRSIVDALEIQLTPQEAEQLAERPIDDVRAQESYLRARSEIWSFLPRSLDLAISHLEAATRLIGDNALIYQGLGEACFQYVNIGAAGGREEELLEKSAWCAERIFALEPESARGYLVLANVQLARGDIHGVGRSLRRVLQVFPNEVVALQLYVHTLGWLAGKPDAAAPLAKRLVEVDPLNAMSLLVNAMVPLFAGRFEAALEPARRMFELDPVTPVWRANHVMALFYARRIDEAEALTRDVVAEPDSDVGTWWMGLMRAAWRGDRAEVVRLADGPYRRAAGWDAEIPWALASAHAAVGAKDEALHWLDRAIGQGMINYPFLSRHDFNFDCLRDDPRFGQLMERARREWERFEA